MKKLLTALILILIFVSPAVAEYTSILEKVHVPSTASGREIVDAIIEDVEMPTWEETGGTSEGYEYAQQKIISEKLNHVTFSTYKHAGDMPITRAVLGSVDFNLRFWPEVVNSLKEYVPSGNYISMSNKADNLTKNAIPRAESAAAHAKDIIPKIVIPISCAILMLSFTIQIILTFLSKDTNTSNFFADFARVMFFIVAILTFRLWVSVVIDVFNFGGYLMAPWGGQEQLQRAIADAANAGSKLDWLKPTSLVIGAMRWASYAAIKVLLISRDVLLAVSLVTGPLCLAIGYLNLYTSNDVIKGFLAGWLQTFFKFQFWGIFSAIALVGLSIVDFISKAGAADPLVVFITAIAFVHVAFNIPKLADNMSGVVISSVLMATFSMASQRASGAAVSAGAGAAKSGAGRILRR